MSSPAFIVRPHSSSSTKTRNKAGVRLRSSTRPVCCGMLSSMRRTNPAAALAVLLLAPRGAATSGAGLIQAPYSSVIPLITRGANSKSPNVLQADSKSSSAGALMGSTGSFQFLAAAAAAENGASCTSARPSSSSTEDRSTSWSDLAVLSREPSSSSSAPAAGVLVQPPATGAPPAPDPLAKSATTLLTQLRRRKERMVGRTPDGQPQRAASSVFKPGAGRAFGGVCVLFTLAQAAGLLQVAGAAEVTPDSATSLFADGHAAATTGTTGTTLQEKWGDQSYGAHEALMRAKAVAEERDRERGRVGTPGTAFSEGESWMDVGEGALSTTWVEVAGIDGADRTTSPTAVSDHGATTTSAHPPTTVAFVGKAAGSASATPTGVVQEDGHGNGTAPTSSSSSIGHVGENGSISNANASQSPRYKPFEAMTDAERDAFFEREFQKWMTRRVLQKTGGLERAEDAEDPTAWSDLELPMSGEEMPGAAEDDSTPATPGDASVRLGPCFPLPIVRRLLQQSLSGAGVGRHVLGSLKHFAPLFLATSAKRAEFEELQLTMADVEQFLLPVLDRLRQLELAGELDNRSEPEVGETVVEGGEGPDDEDLESQTPNPASSSNPASSDELFRLDVGYVGLFTGLTTPDFYTLGGTALVIYYKDEAPPRRGQKTFRTSTTSLPGPGGPPPQSAQQFAGRARRAPARERLAGGGRGREHRQLCLRVEVDPGVLVNRVYTGLLLAGTLISSTMFICFECRYRRLQDRISMTSKYLFGQDLDESNPSLCSSFNSGAAAAAAEREGRHSFVPVGTSGSGQGHNHGGQHQYQNTNNLSHFDLNSAHGLRMGSNTAGVEDATGVEQRREVQARNGGAGSYLPGGNIVAISPGYGMSPDASLAGTTTHGGSYSFGRGREDAWLGTATYLHHDRANPQHQGDVPIPYHPVSPADEFDVGANHNQQARLQLPLQLPVGAGMSNWGRRGGAEAAGPQQPLPFQFAVQTYAAPERGGMHSQALGDQSGSGSGSGGTGFSASSSSTPMLSRRTNSNVLKRSSSAGSGRGNRIAPGVGVEVLRELAEEEDETAGALRSPL